MRLFKRAGGSIWYGWYYARSVAGETSKVQRSTRCTDRRAAERVVAQWERDAADPRASKARQATLRQALQLVLDRADRLAQTGRRSVSTASFYDAKIAVLAKLLDPDKTKLLASLCADDLDRYVATRREQGVLDTTIAKEIGALRLALKLATRTGLWVGDRAAVLPELEDAAYVPRTRWLTHEEVQRLLAELVADRGARVAFIVATGARWSETESTTRAQVDGAIVHLRGTKTAASDRLVPLALESQRQLLEYALSHAEGDLFTPWASVRRDLAAACRRAKIAPCTPNDLRRTFTHWLRGAGAPSDLVALAMGHADSRMVERVYGRLVGAELASALGRATASPPVHQPPRMGPGTKDPADADCQNSAENLCPGSESNQRHEDFQPPCRVSMLLPRPRKDSRSTAERRARSVQSAGAAPAHQQLRPIRKKVS